MDNSRSNYQEIIENILGIDKEEFQKIDLKTSATGIPYWSIKVYSLLGEEEKLVNLLIAIDGKLRETFFNESRTIPTTSLKDLTKFHRWKDATVCIELNRTAKNIYTCNIVMRSKVNEELDMINKIKSLKDMLLNIVNK